MKEPMEQDVPTRIEAIRRRIDECLDEDEGHDVLARAADLSPFHFHRLFRGFVGETVVGYRRRRRLERAAERISAGAEDLLGVALEAGYGSHEAFTRAYRRTFGISPSDHRSRSTWETPTMNPTLSPRIELTEPMTVACVRHTGPYEDVGSAWKAIMSWGWRKMIFGSPRTFGLSHDDPDAVESSRLRYDACMEVKPGTRVKGDVRLEELPGGSFAVALHVGPYAEFGRTYAALFAYVESEAIDGNRWRLGAPPCREVYLNDPRKTAPAELRTEIWVAVEPIAAR